jgi:hypothetical protein
MTINGQTVTEKDVQDYLAQEKGPIVKKELVQRILIDQQAKKNHLVPSRKEIDDAFNEEKELKPQFAQEIAVAPWYETEAKNRIRVNLEQIRLRSKDVQVSDDDIKYEYSQHPQLYDAPDKAVTNLALIKDPSRMAEIKRLMEQGISPADITRDFSGAVVFPGDNYQYTFVRPFGTNAQSTVFAMKPNEVKQVPPGPNEQQQGIQGIVIRLLEIKPGHKYDPSDAAAKEKIRLSVASKRMKPLQEWLATVWAETRFEGEEPGDKQMIENLMFPDRAKR